MKRQYAEILSLLELTLTEDFPYDMSCTTLPGFSFLCNAWFVFIDVDECSSYPCLNGARCEDKQNGFLCHCELYYTGVQCQKGQCWSGLRFAIFATLLLVKQGLKGSVKVNDQSK